LDAGHGRGGENCKKQKIIHRTQRKSTGERKRKKMYMFHKKYVVFQGI
jgi:hypothetical protein